MSNKAVEVVKKASEVIDVFKITRYDPRRKVFLFEDKTNKPEPELREEILKYFKKIYKAKIIYQHHTFIKDVIKQINYIKE